MTHLAGGKGFTQVKNDFLWPHWAGLADCPAAVRVLFWLMAHMNKINHVYDARQEVLMAGTGLPRKSIYRALRFLEERKFHRAAKR